MSRRSRRGSRAGGPRAQISMDSLIDLTFLLLVTFMVTMPALEQGVAIQLPRAEAKPLPHKDNKVNTISLNEKKEIYLNEDRLGVLGDGRGDGLRLLEDRLLVMVAADPDVPVLVRGDKELRYREVMKVVETVYKCQVHKMALVTQGD